VPLLKSNAPYDRVLGPGSVGVIALQLVHGPVVAGAVRVKRVVVGEGYVDNRIGSRRVEECTLRQALTVQFPSAVRDDAGLPCCIHSQRGRLDRQSRENIVEDNVARRGRCRHTNGHRHKVSNPSHQLVVTDIVSGTEIADRRDRRCRRHDLDHEVDNCLGAS
jgi:hypothetical protein